MDRRWTSFLAFTLTILVSSAALTEDRKAFKVIYLYEISNKGEKARIRTRATKSRVAAIQAEINGDPALVARLRAMNIQISNIIGADRAANGTMIYYIR